MIPRISISQQLDILTGVKPAHYTLFALSSNQRAVPAQHSALPFLRKRQVPVALLGLWKSLEIKGCLPQQPFNYIVQS